MAAPSKPPKSTTKRRGACHQRFVRRSLGYCVLVHWADSAARPGWNDVDQSGPAIIASVGILMRYTEAAIVLAMGISTSGRCHEQITIPRGCITHVEQLSPTPVEPNDV
jgi:hypothetical protein